MGKKVNNLNVRIDDELRSLVVRASGALQLSDAEFIRACILTAAPLLLACPILTRIIDTDQYRVSNLSVIDL